jgi:cytochrome c biogenesis protein CcmG/thiol:disulfide interchange protein DsbE
MEKLMKVKLTLLLMLFAAVISIGCEKRGEQKEDRNEEGQNETYEKSEGGEKADDFKLISTDGKELKLSDFKGKIVLLDFWATWCGPCRRGIPDLIDLQKKYKDDLVVIGISLDRETKNDVIPFIKEFKINYSVVYGDAAVVKAYGNIQSIPTSFVIDREGKLVDQHVGLMPKSVYENEIKKLL